MTLYDFVAHDQASIDENTRLSMKKGRHDIGERRYPRRDGELAYVEVRSNTLLIDGREVMCCVSHDITERKLAEQRRDTKYGVSLILAESASLEEASPKLLDAIGAGLGWELGALWMVDRDANVPRCKEVWCAPWVAVTGFEAASWDTSATPGRELPGRVWESEEPVWIPDVFNDTNFLRAKSVARAGLRGAFAFPIRSKGRVLARGYEPADVP